MTITQIQKPPLHPIYEVDDVTNYHDFVDWMMRRDLGENISVDLDGDLFHFETVQERLQWLLGFQKAWDLLGKHKLAQRQRDRAEKEHTHA